MDNRGAGGDGWRELGEAELIRLRFRRGEPFAVYFHTPWCGTCRMGERMLDIVRAMEPDALLYKADVNFMPAIVREWKIESVPCLVFVENKRVAEKMYSMRSVPFLLEAVRRRLIPEKGGEGPREDRRFGCRAL